MDNRPINWNIKCAIYECSARIIVEEPLPFAEVNPTMQVRRAWFSHMRDTHPDDYARLSPHFARALAERRAVAALREAQKVERFRLDAKREAKRRKQEITS